MTNQEWTPAGGSVVEPVACFCGKCGAFMPKTYVSHSRIALIGDTVLSQCCRHRLSIHGNVQTWTFGTEAVVVTLDSSRLCGLDADPVMSGRGNWREEVGPSGQTGDADALQPVEVA